MSDDLIPGASSSLPEQLSRWGVDLRQRHIVVVQLMAAPLIPLLPRVGRPIGATIAMLTLLSVIATYNEATAARWLARLVRFLWHRKSAAARLRRAAIPAPFNVDLAGIGAVGMRWDGQYAVTMIALHGRAYAPTFLVPGGAKTEDIVPLQVVASLLRQFGGLELASVDVVSAGRRTGSAAFASVYDEIIGDRPAVGLRETWLVLRLCPRACLAAMAYRGDAAAAAAAATERMRQAVLRSGCRAVTCSADQLAMATNALLGGIDLAEVRESWTHIDTGGAYVTTYRIAGADLTTELVNDVWSVRSLLTVLTVRLAATASGSMTAAAIVRFHTAAQATHPPVLTLRSVSGQAFSAVLASLPLGDRSVALQMSARQLEPAGLEMPLAPAGFMIGTTHTGFPLLLPLHDPLRPTRVGLSVEPGVAQSLVLRATATGSTVLVHTNRPELWAPICSEHIVLADRLTDHPGAVTMVVLDGDHAQNPAMAVGERGHTVVSISSTPPPDADVVLTQASPGQLTLTTPRFADVPLRILRPRNETQFLAHLRGTESLVSVTQ
ncbi:type VII secretion protein EccE [Mycobacterium sp. SP-6446]|uniref:type VII secretion protein EccE n=1 Tax=Mycobacterium sp. SP-6446 TaxID=1834162 RepID=UPI00096F99E9|nr:type VII secretion protein EccE [Mycobacterium sp. SP-6446]OMC13522.1 type VII secretion protein EccE [Mycobacterium sp. SP-6446]